MSPANNTVRMVVLLADSGVYLFNFFKLNPDLHNLKKSSILPRIGLLGLLCYSLDDTSF